MSLPMILLYHRVAELENDPQLLAVTPEHFAAHLEVLREFATFAPLAELARPSRFGRQLENVVAITFDDGYADNLYFASPILHRQGVPATVFVATGGLSDAREFFWDDLERIFLSANRLPAKLQLSVGTARVEIDLAADQVFAGGFADWDVTQAKNPTARHAAYRKICELLHHATVAQREAAMDFIQQWSGLASGPRESHLMMTRPQLRDLARSGLIEVGGHTVNHPLLRVESREDQQREISECKTTLESILERPVTSFSYPFGGRRDYGAESVAAVREAGYDVACSNFPGQLQAGTDRLQIPRMLVRDWSADEFRAHLINWIGQRVSLAA